MPTTTPRLPDALFLALAQTLATTGLDDDGDSKHPVYLLSSDRWWAAYLLGDKVMVLTVEEPPPDLSGIVDACCRRLADHWRAVAPSDIPRAAWSVIASVRGQHRPTAWTSTTAEA